MKSEYPAYSVILKRLAIIKLWRLHNQTSYIKNVKVSSFSRLSNETMGAFPLVPKPVYQVV